ncbi:hypothetical protein THAOC_06009, partial [Thalassiosira oceanica]
NMVSTVVWLTSRHTSHNVSQHADVEGSQSVGKGSGDRTEVMIATASGKEPVDRLDEGRDLRDSINGSLINVGVLAALMMALSGASESSPNRDTLLLKKSNFHHTTTTLLPAKFIRMERQNLAFASGRQHFRSELRSEARRRRVFVSMCNICFPSL